MGRVLVDKVVEQGGVVAGEFVEWAGRCWAKLGNGLSCCRGGGVAKVFGVATYPSVGLLADHIFPSDGNRGTTRNLQLDIVFLNAEEPGQVWCVVDIFIVRLRYRSLLGLFTQDCIFFHVPPVCG